jgi:hypothetical protein
VKLVYVGPHGVVDVPLPHGGWAEARWGEEFDVPDSLGERLLDQPSNWKKAAEPKKATAAEEKK